MPRSAIAEAIGRRSLLAPAARRLVVRRASGESHIKPYCGHSPAKPVAQKRGEAGAGLRLLAYHLTRLIS